MAQLAGVDVRSLVSSLGAGLLLALEDHMVWHLELKCLNMHLDHSLHSDWEHSPVEVHMRLRRWTVAVGQTWLKIRWAEARSIGYGASVGYYIKVG